MFLWVNTHEVPSNLFAFFDNSGSVVERYAYDPFGSVTVLDADWNVRAASDFAWLYLHQGGQSEAVSVAEHFWFLHYLAYRRA